MKNSNQSENTKKENKMGTMPVTKLLLNMSLPIMFSMLVQACYNIVDSIFVSKLSEAALTAVSMAFPFQTMVIAIGIGTAVGANAVLAMRLGQKNQDAVNKVAVNAVFLALLSFVAFFIIGATCVKPFFHMQTENQKIFDYGTDYLSVVLLGSFGAFFGITLDRLLQATGRTFYTMITMLIGAVTNIILDPLLIFGIGIFPRLEMKGAALATIIGQIVAACFSYWFNKKKNPDIQFHFRKFRPDPEIIRQIYKIGIPTILMMSINSLTTFGMNIILEAFSSTAVAVYGSYFRLNSFIFMPVFGLNTGMIPIVSFNFGARNRARITKTIKSALIMSVSIMTVGVIIFEFMPDRLLALFNASEHMLSIGVPAFRTIAPSFFGASLAIVLSGVFQALGRSFYSMMVSFVRQLIVLLPVAWYFSLSGDINHVWFCFLVAEIFAISLSVFYYLRCKKNLLNF